MRILLYKYTSIHTQEQQCRLPWDLFNNDFFLGKAEPISIIFLLSGNRFKMFPLFPDGYELPNHSRQTVYPNGTLIVESAHKLTDEGFYSCTAFNQRDESHMGTVQIEVLSK